MGGIISSMRERRFDNEIVLGVHPGEIWLKGQMLENPIKRVKISPQILDDLESLAIMAFANESGDSEGQQFLNESLAKMKLKYSNEEPQEVWKRDIAGLVTQGVEAKNIATQLYDRSLKTLPYEAREKVINTIRNKILDFWPSKKS